MRENAMQLSSRTKGLNIPEAFSSDSLQAEGVHDFHGAQSARVRPDSLLTPYVPTRNGAWSLRSVAITDNATMRPVLGFSDGTFSIVNENRAASASTSMKGQFLTTAGSAQMSIVVRSGPMPARDSAAATLTFSGKPAAASRAVPANTRFAALRPSTEMPFLTR